MSRGLYVLLITIIFGIAYLPDLVGTVFGERILILIPRVNIKTFLIFFIAVMEANFIKRQWPGIFGWIFAATLFIGIMMRVIHWSGSYSVILISLIFLLWNLIYHAIKENNKSLFHYLLFGYIGLRVAIIIARPREMLWWMDLGLGSIIAIYGLINIIGRKRVNPT